jgi:hypothetical protein
MRPAICRNSLSIPTKMGSNSHTKGVGAGVVAAEVVVLGGAVVVVVVVVVGGSGVVIVVGDGVVVDVVVASVVVAVVVVSFTSGDEICVSGVVVLGCVYMISLPSPCVGVGLVVVGGWAREGGQGSPSGM